MELVFTKGKSFFSKAILYLTHHSWLGTSMSSHVANRYGGLESNWMVEATAKGFIPNWWPRYGDSHDIVRRFEIINVDEKIVDEVMDGIIDRYINTEYNFIGIFGFLIAIGVYWATGKRIKNPLANDKFVFCSESTCMFLMKLQDRIGQKILSKDYDPELVFPDDLLIECENNKQFFKEI